jgi:hypothetical protein
MFIQVMQKKPTTEIKLHHALNLVITDFHFIYEGSNFITESKHKAASVLNKKNGGIPQQPTASKTAITTQWIGS